MTRSERIEAAADKVLETSESPNHTNVQDEDAVLVSFSKIEALRAALALPQETGGDREQASQLQDIIDEAIIDSQESCDHGMISRRATDAILALFTPVCTCGHDNPEQGGHGHGVFCPCNPNRASVQVQSPAETCVWTQDDDGNWDTGCDNIHILIDGGPDENQMRFCCYCGKRIQEAKP